MTWTVTNLVPTTVDDGGLATVSVSSQTYFADTLYLLATRATGNITPNVVGTSVTGGGLTWVKGNFKGSTLGRLEWWWTVPTVTTTTALTVTYPEVVAAASYAVDQIDGVDTVSPFIQGNEANGTTNVAVSGAGAVSVPLAIHYTTGSLLWACFGSSHNVTATPRSGWTESTDYTSGTTTPEVTVQTQYRTTSDTQAATTFATSGQSYACIVELRPGTTVRLRPDTPAVSVAATAPTLLNDTITIRAPGARLWSDSWTWADDETLWSGGWMQLDMRAEAPSVVIAPTTSVPAATVSWAMSAPTVDILSTVDVPHAVALFDTTPPSLLLGVGTPTATITWASPAPTIPAHDDIHSVVVTAVVAAFAAGTPSLRIDQDLATLAATIAWQLVAPQPSVRSDPHLEPAVATIAWRFMPPRASGSYAYHHH